MKLILAALIFSTAVHAVDQAGCLPQLERSLCYSNAVNHWAHDQSKLVANLRRFQERTCLVMPANMKETIVSLYLQYPKGVQQAFCEIKKFFIVKGEVDFGGRAEYYFDPATVKLRQGEWNPHFSGKPTGFVLEISEANRFKGETASAFTTRVLRGRFGSETNKDRLPVSDYQTPFGTHGALATTIVHEIGHLLGRAQKVTSTYFLPLSEGAWSRQSFRLDLGSFVLRHASADYSYRMLEKSLSAQDISATFELFRAAGLATLYGGVSPQEDFAEFFMLYHYGNIKWSVENQVVFDLNTELSSNPVFRSKRDMIERMMNLPAPFSLKNRGTVSGELGIM